MTFVGSIVLLASLVFAVAGPLFFGHALVENDSAWYGAGALCVGIAVALFVVQKRLRASDERTHS